MKKNFEKTADSGESFGAVGDEKLRKMEIKEAIRQSVEKFKEDLEEYVISCLKHPSYGSSPDIDHKRLLQSIELFGDR